MSKMRHRHRLYACALLAWAAVPFAAGCGGDTFDPGGVPPPDISTPGGLIRALEEHYSYQRPDNALALLHPDYTFTPARPDSIDWLAGAPSWDRDAEENILEDLLDGVRESWIDQVLLEVAVDSVAPATDPDSLPVGATVSVHTRVDLSLLLPGSHYQAGHSKVVFVCRREDNGDFLLLEERESVELEADRTVGELKAVYYDTPEGG
ncbi:MAG: hypothetical protein QF819_04645 [Gemmatimonadota bacterium]|nr:hypothetical protein [Gemmatimonadota bacterium]MDP6461535.1 hypothetical protein [Gemmatimonadota bacterium]MDP6802447.1 hypothetical protein [Gemmatimonadota bacterium]MDP7030997.1 hypothetical protein [Gemmatimonadota bacterium]